MKSRNSIVLILVSACALVVGCSTLQSAEKKPQTIAYEYSKPFIQPLPETEPAQTKGGLSISLAPISYNVKHTRKIISMERAAPSLGSALLAGATGNEHKGKKYVRVKTAMKPVIVPNRLVFLVTIRNQMSHVFRGAGSIVQFNVNGTLQGVNQKSYRELTQAIIPPRGQIQLKIYGPPINNIPNNATIGIFFYDLVTKMDEAGRVVEKQNYKWYYSYSSKTQSDTVNVRVDEGWIPIR